MKSVIVGTAGHIDHGKSSLVKALTGTDPDRWEEEQRRGITIDLGFAHCTVAGDLQLDFVDVPGHERFVKNMLAGAGGIDLVLFVVAADESIKPQTREHFDICRLLGIKGGVVALTKSDLSSPDMIGLVRLEVEELVAGSFLEGAPIVAVSARTGAGMEDLLAELGSLAGRIRQKDSSRPFRLPIDRAFVMKGFGTVVTGTLVAGSIHRDEAVEIYPTGRPARARGVQAHGSPAESARAGQRTALNLAGVDASEIERGMVLAAPGRFRPTVRFDARLHLLTSARPLKHRAPVHLHAGTAECVADIILMPGQEAMHPGESGWVQIHAHGPQLLLPGDRFILRQFSPVITIAGGVVLDPLAARRKSGDDPALLLTAFEEGDPIAILDALLQLPAYRGGAAGDEILARTGWTNAELAEAAKTMVIASTSPLILLHPKRCAEYEQAVSGELRKFHTANPLIPGLPKEELRERLFRRAQPAVFQAVLDGLAKARKAEVSGDIVREAGRRIVLNDAEARSKQQIGEAFEKAGLAVPSTKEVLASLPVEPNHARKILQILLKERQLVMIGGDLVFHHTALDRLRELLAARKLKDPRLNVGTFKDLAGISRKYAIPLLEYLDREHVTRRVGDERIIL